MGSNFCDICLTDLPKLGRVCSKCALPLGSIQSRVCGPCLLTPPPWQQLRCLLPYQAPVDSLLKRLKYQGETNIACALGELMADYLQSFDDAPIDLILPVPLHPRRYWRRGFNQALELAKPISKKLGIPISTALCYRAHLTEDQAALQHHKRHNNVAGAFKSRAHPISGKHVVIIDDVITTGATITAVASSLQRLDVKISAWACARTRIQNI